MDAQVGVASAERINFEWGVTTIPISSDGSDAQNNNVEEEAVAQWHPIAAPTFCTNSAGTTLVNVNDKLVAVSSYGTLENDCMYDLGTKR